MKFEIQFPGCNSPGKLFDRPIVDPLAFPGSLGRGLNWRKSKLLEPLGQSIHWAGSFDCTISDQEILPCRPSTLVLARHDWFSTLGQITLAEFVFAAEWVLSLKDLMDVGFRCKAREIGFPIRIFHPLINGHADVIVELQDLEREGGHYLPWQMGTNMNSQWIVYRKGA